MRLQRFSRQEPARPERDSGFRYQYRTDNAIAEKRLISALQRRAAISGISISPLRSVLRIERGYVFNFRDITDLRRLAGVATKERMAALGVFLPPSRTRFASPSRPWPERQGTGSSRPAGEDDEQRPGKHCQQGIGTAQTPSSPIPQLSREKTYEFQEADVRSLLDETLMLIEKTGARRQVSDCARFNWSRIARARGCNKIQAGLLESL